VRRRVWPASCTNSGLYPPISDSCESIDAFADTYARTYPASVNCPLAEREQLTTYLRFPGWSQTTCTLTSRLLAADRAELALSTTAGPGWSLDS
jgi:hypothetical protein